MINITKTHNNKFLKIELPHVILYFSYSTLVAFRFSGLLYIDEYYLNYTHTTSIHLNSILEEGTVFLKSVRFEILSNSLFGKIDPELLDNSVNVLDIISITGGINTHVEKQNLEKLLELNDLNEIKENIQKLIDHPKNVKDTTLCSVWAYDDVKETDIGQDLTDNEVINVLSMLDNNHDAEIGINWITIETFTDMIIGDRNNED